jgi:hypothetical protein
MKEAKQIEPFRERKGKDIARSLIKLICLHGIVFQFLNRRRTQFEFKDYEHIQRSLLAPLASTGIWRTWDAS